MLCDRCQKREAKILYTEIINGSKKEEHLCEDCATDFTSFQMEKPILNSELTLGDLLSTIIDSYTSGGTKDTGNIKPEIKCGDCGTTYEEFLQKGRFGCANCYKSFSNQINKTMKGIHGADVHTGKQPKGFIRSTEQIISNMTEVERLALELQEAIEKEEFEKAARLRDKIRAMKKEEAGNA